MIYVTRIPGDSEIELSWYHVYGTRNEAMAEARSHASELGWKVKYISQKTAENGVSYFDYEGKDTIVVEQLDHLYYGA
jgi:hypothetical protein